VKRERNEKKKKKNLPWFLLFKSLLLNQSLFWGRHNVPFCGQAKVRLTGALSKGGKMRGVTTNVYLWKTSEKPKEAGQNENSKFRSCIYA